MGGTCLNWGCIPTKALLRGVEILDLVEGGKDYGILAGPVTVDFAKLMARKDRAVKTLVGGVSGLMKANGIEVVKGTGKLVSPQKIEVVDAQAGERNLPGPEDHPRRRVGFGGNPDSRREAARGDRQQRSPSLKQIPESMVIIGAGPIGLEFGTVYAALGAKVTVLEMLPQILPSEDPEIAAALEKTLRRFKIQTLTGVKVQKIAEGPEGKLQVTAAAGGEEKSFSRPNMS